MEKKKKKKLTKEFIVQFQRQYCSVCGTQRCLGRKEEIRDCGYYNYTGEAPFRMNTTPQTNRTVVFDLGKVVDLLKSHLNGNEMDRTVLKMILNQLQQMFGYGIFVDDYLSANLLSLSRSTEDTRIKCALKHLEKYIDVMKV